MLPLIGQTAQHLTSFGNMLFFDVACMDTSPAGRYGQRTAEAMQTAKAMSQIRIAETFAHIISEHAGIVCASAIFSFGSVTGMASPPSHLPFTMKLGRYKSSRAESLAT